jgi:TetR/AcrR family transcriptional regulator
MADISLKEEAILAAAMDVFIEKGRHGATMQEIADRAGINKAMLHYYFRSKENIYGRIFESVFLKLMNSLIISLDEGLDFKTHLRMLINKFHDTILNNPRLPLFIARELSEGGATVSSIVSRLIQENKIEGPPRIIASIRRAVEQEEIAFVGDPLQLMMTIIGSCIYFFVAEPIFRALFPTESGYNRDQFIEERKEAIFHTIYFGIKPRGETV